MPEYERPKDISVKDIAEGAAALLASLFSEVAFSDKEKRMYRYACAGCVESFIYRELIKFSGVINFKTTENAGKDSEFLYRLVMVYFLHCRYNSKLERGNKEDYTLQTLDSYLYRVIRGAVTNCGKSFYMEEKKFFDVVSKSSFVLILPHTRYVWNAPRYSEQVEGCVQITLSITSFDDENKETYEEFVKYLLTAERNSIHDFSDNSSLFWRHAVGLTRSGQTYNIENTFAPDKDLILLCLALGYDNKVLDRLIELRNEAMNAHYKRNGRRASVRNFQTPFLDENDEKELRKLLDHSATRLAEVKLLEADSEKIPRRMLFNANLEWLKVSHKPIINLKAEEVTEFESLLEKHDEEIFADKYDRNKNENEWKIIK